MYRCDDVAMFKLELFKLSSGLLVKQTKLLVYIVKHTQTQSDYQMFVISDILQHQFKQNLTIVHLEDFS